MDTLSLILLIIWTPLLLAYGLHFLIKFRHKNKIHISKNKSESLWHSLLR